MNDLKVCWRPIDKPIVDKNGVLRTWPSEERRRTPHSREVDAEEYKKKNWQTWTVSSLFLESLNTYCLMIVPSFRRISPHPPLSVFRSPVSPKPNGYFAAAFSSTSIPQPGASFTYQ